MRFGVPSRWSRWWQRVRPPWGRDGSREVDRIRSLATARRFDDAERAARRLLERRASRHGVDTMPWAESAWLLLEVRLGAGKAAEPESLELAGRLLQFEEARGGAHTVEVAATLRKLAFIAAAGQEPQAAVPHLARALAILEGVHGLDDTALVPVLTNLGLTQFRSGDRAAARATLERSLAVQRRSEPRGDYYFPTLYRLAQLWAMEGNPAAAIPLLEEALAFGEATLGAEHLSLGAASFTLGQALMMQDRPEEAMPQLRRTLATEEAQLGPDHVEVASTLIELAGAESATGDTDGALVHLERALAVLEQHFGTEGIEIVPALGALARLQFAREDTASCRHTLQRLLAIEERAFGPGNERLVVTLSALASVAEASGNFVEARRVRERALATGEALWGKTDHRLVALLEPLSSLFAEADEWTRCRALNERLLEIHRRELGETHPTVTGKLQELALIAAHAGDFGESSRRFGEALSIVERSPAGQAAQLQSIVRHLAGLWEAQDREGPFGVLLQRARVQERRTGGGGAMPEA